ncbi:hypothetical protein AKJ09_08057 [Labilithrix luteola]|uniref:Uncharacterized protein n=1 Tax=Labilithrix luteola TaxID=1391654 RepID=A0A0K1Q6Q3_9BACT|nr:hypothetical protein [Labilithrix luteola]AKV01394.1 hypothetical protein AKJ09_08057 [Labilithrix luteola]
MDCLAYGTPVEKDFAIAAMGSLVGLLVTAFTLGYASIEKKHPENVVIALRIWAISAAPPMLSVAFEFVGGGFAKGASIGPGSMLVGVSVFSIMVAPFTFLGSFGAVLPGKGGLAMELLRVTIFLGWLCAAFIALSIAAAI